MDLGSELGVNNGLGAVQDAHNGVQLFGVDVREDDCVLENTFVSIYRLRNLVTNSPLAGAA
jgi:hypothetical protein